MNFPSQPCPLGLTLRKTQSLENLVKVHLSKEKEVNFTTQDDQDSYNKYKGKSKIDGSETTSDQCKPSNIYASSITIGNWQYITKNEGDLVVKIYYAKRKLVWEVLNGSLKSKIEIQWSGIIAIRANMHDRELGMLEIELNEPPSFYGEINPQPRKHTVWKQASDFTGGQALVWRIHSVAFPPKVLDKHYRQLLQYDQSLFALSLKPFPSQISPYFDDSFYNSNRHGSRHLPRVQYPICPTIVMETPNSMLSVVDHLHLTQNQTSSWNQGANFAWGNANIQGSSTIISVAPQNHVIPYQNYQPNSGLLDIIENNVQGDSQNFRSYEPTFHGEVGLLYLDLAQMDVYAGNNASSSGTEYENEGQVGNNSLPPFMLSDSVDDQ